MTIHIDALYVQCDKCGEDCAMSHTMIGTEPEKFKQTILEYIKSGFEFYDLHGWKVYSRRRRDKDWSDIICGDCLKKIKEVA